MHEVELIKRVRVKLRSAVDIADLDVRAPAEETIRRVIVAALEILGIRIRLDGEIMMPLKPERTAADRESAVMTGVREYAEGYPVELRVIPDDQNGAGRLAICAQNEGGCNGIDIDLADLVAWLAANRPSLLDGSDPGNEQP